MNVQEDLRMALSFLLTWMVKASFLLVAVLVAQSMLRNKSGALRHRVLALGILGSLLLPLAGVLLPNWQIGNRLLAGQATRVSGGTAISTFEDLPAMVVNVTMVNPIASRIEPVVTAIWLAGFLVWMSRLAVGLAQVEGVARRTTPDVPKGWLLLAERICGSLAIRRKVRILWVADRFAMPVTWGYFRPRVLLPWSAREWPESRVEMILTHELAHVARADWLSQMTAETLCAVHWCNPLVWIAARRLRQESERACDDVVLRRGIAPRAYAREVLGLAGSLRSSLRGWSSALALVGATFLERRFAAMLSAKTDRSGVSRKAGRWSAVAALCVVIPIAALRLPAQGNAGRLTGRVLDPAGAGVQNATVILSDPLGNVTSMTATDGNGSYGFKGLAAGSYGLQVERSGFEICRVARVALQERNEVVQNMALMIASTHEEADGNRPDSEKAKRTKIAGQEEAQRIVKKVAPLYPESARSAGVAGEVMLDAVIGADGKVLSLRVMNTEVDPSLATSAVEAVRQWRYKPTLRNGSPVEVETTVMVKYSLLP
jgi:TonB family protein